MIAVRLRDTNPGETQQDKDADAAEETPEAAEAEDDTAPDATSLADLLHMLEGVAGEGRNWFHGREWAGIWPGDDADRGEGTHEMETATLTSGCGRRSRRQARTPGRKR
jgi:hypothetical protein